MSGDTRMASWPALSGGRAVLRGQPLAASAARGACRLAGQRPCSARLAGRTLQMDSSGSQVSSSLIMVCMAGHMVGRMVERMGRVYAVPFLAACAAGAASAIQLWVAFPPVRRTGAEQNARSAPHRALWRQAFVRVK
jgi:uncharacterized protein YgiB involved in biofilm formation